MNIYVDGKVHVRATRCKTCIFRPGNLMDLEPGRVDSMVAQATADDSTIPCHSHLYRGEPIQPVCRGFYELHATLPLRLADSFGITEFVDPEVVS